MRNKDHSHRAQNNSRSTDSDRPRWPFVLTNFQLVGQLDWLGIATLKKWFFLKKKKKKERKKILCLSHFIIIKLCEAVNVKRLEINRWTINFFFEMFPMLQCKEFLCIQGDVFVFYWILFYNNYQYFFMFWPVTNEPWANLLSEMSHDWVKIC